MELYWRQRSTFAFRTFLDGIWFEESLTQLWLNKKTFFCLDVDE
jgi:hypothetical protein